MGGKTQRGVERPAEQGEFPSLPHCCGERTDFGQADSVGEMGVTLLHPKIFSSWDQVLLPPRLLPLPKQNPKSQRPFLLLVSVWDNCLRNFGAGQSKQGRRRRRKRSIDLAKCAGESSLVAANFHCAVRITREEGGGISTPYSGGMKGEAASACVSNPLLSKHALNTPVTVARALAAIVFWYKFFSFCCSGSILVEK